MLAIKNLEFLIRIGDPRLHLGSVGTNVNGNTHAGHGFAVGTVNSTATGSLTQTYGHTSALVIQTNLISWSKAYSFGSAYAYDDGAKSHTAARYRSISTTRR